MGNLWYSWTSLSYRPGDVPVAMGISDDEHSARDAAAAAVEAGDAFIGYIKEVRPGLTADFLLCYVPTGREWHGRKAADGKVRWNRLRPAVGAGFCELMIRLPGMPR
jgi:hypothetical protein